MKYTPKFRAYISKLEMYVHELTLYPNGDIGLDSDYFEPLLKAKNKDFSIYWDDNCILHATDDGEIYDDILSIHTADDWIQIDADEVVLEQWTGKFIYTESKGSIIAKTPLFEGDKLDFTEHKGFLMKSGILNIFFDADSSCFWYFHNTSKITVPFTAHDEFDYDILKFCKIIGNVNETDKWI